jgi:hypothetical protein
MVLLEAFSSRTAAVAPTTPHSVRYWGVSADSCLSHPMPIHAALHLAVSIGESEWLEQPDAAFTKAGGYGAGSN